jgi:hypothetical protein
MAGDEPLADDVAPVAEPPRRRRVLGRLARWLGGGLIALLVLLGLAVAWLHTGSGRQFVVGQIASYAPASGPVDRGRPHRRLGAVERDAATT